MLEVRIQGAPQDRPRYGGDEVLLRCAIDYEARRRAAGPGPGTGGAGKVKRAAV